MINGFIQDVRDLEERLSRPNAAVVNQIANVKGDVLILGAGGKMGPSLTRMIKRGVDECGGGQRVIAVSRFSNRNTMHGLAALGIKIISCDLLDPESLQTLPDAPNIIFMAGMKFGLSGNLALTWAMNVELPALVCRRFPASRLVVFSTGNVYAPAIVSEGGSSEDDLQEPVGEYGMSCLGRERIFEHHSLVTGMPVSTLRLSYAVEMRYGVLVDIGLKVFSGEPVDLTMGSFCCIWQGDANALAIQSLAHAASPPFVVNLTGTEILNVREVALTFGKLMKREPLFSGCESGKALVSRTGKMQDVLGRPSVSVDSVIRWTADWLMRGGETLNRPTHFDTTDGRY